MMLRGINGKNLTVPRGFKKTTTDEQRVSIAYNYMGFEENESQAPDTTGSSKSTQVAEQSRLAGNIMFNCKTQLCHVALRLYTKSIAFAPYPATPQDYSPQLAFGYANRSAALYALGYYEECMEDIARALAFRYPPMLTFKLLERKGRCERSLGRENDVANTLEAALAALSLCTLPEDRANGIRSSICRRLAPDAPNIGEPKETPAAVCPPKSYGENATMPSASDCIKMVYTEEFGRQMIATKDIYPGDIVIVEPPFAAAFIMNTKGKAWEKPNHTHCSTCMKRCPALVPCKFCSTVMFCNETCRKTSWKQYHRYECPVIGVLQSIPIEGNIFLLLRIVLMACHKNGGVVGLYKAIKAMEMNPNKDQLKGFNEEGKYDSSDYTTVHNLLPHTDKRSTYQLFLLAIHASIITKTLDNLTDFFSQVEGVVLPPDGNGSPQFKDWKLFIGGVILRNLQAMTTNACGIAEHVEEPGDNSLVRIKLAHGVYPTSAMLNHSCNPNVLSHFRNGNVRAVMAVRPIMKGEQLFIALGESYVTAPLPKRRSFLQEHLFFTCKCEACTERWTIPTPLDSAEPLVMPNTRWRCSLCLSTLLPVPPSRVKRIESFVHVCPMCHTRHSHSWLTAELQSIAMQSLVLFTAVREGNTPPTDYRLQLAEQLAKVERIIQPPHPLTVSIHEYLHQNFAMLGNYYKV